MIYSGKYTIETSSQTHYLGQNENSRSQKHKSMPAVPTGLVLHTGQSENDKHTRWARAKNWGYYFLTSYKVYQTLVFLLLTDI